MAAAKQADIGLIGLAVMGQNLVLNMNDHGFTVAVFNRTVSKVDDFLKGPAKNTHVIGTHSLEEFFKSLKRPRKVMMMVKAGAAVDELIEECLPFLEKGDIIIDGGNTHYPDSERRNKFLQEKGILFIGTGISGGEEGARHGPSIMPGGNPDAWPAVKPIFQSIAAKAEDGTPCCDWVGNGGAGHYVKMVHNGIEYGDMQLICEAYHLLKDSLQCTAEEFQNIFSEWNRGPLKSYLIEITSQIFGYKDTDGKPLVDKILDVAGQKGTGKWTGISALDLGIPVTLINEAVFARCVSALKDQRMEASKLFPHKKQAFAGDRQKFIDHIQQALYASKIISYAQGFMLMRAAAQEMKWQLNYGSIALMWREGCIIRSGFLSDINNAFKTNPDLKNLLFDSFFKEAIQESEKGWRHAVSHAFQSGIPIPCFSTALSFFDGYRTAQLPANLLQAQRDFFGSHAYEMIDQPRGKFFHTNWAGKGGSVSATTYNV
ncbi:MAG TPA: decarboxylating NADP(+)-dependent phosphogluconate dehydrogenase [Rhabdochlamydiaceae bacterium]|nr:decarboxylating NADP(+)-dependent phosphogluconate dehydrogenase [Rhabdochlamydiaceae bacterium]